MRIAYDRMRFVYSFASEEHGVVEPLAVVAVAQRVSVTSSVGAGCSGCVFVGECFSPPISTRKPRMKTRALEQLGRRHQYGGFRGSPCSLRAPYGTVSRSSE